MRPYGAQCPTSASERLADRISKCAGPQCVFDSIGHDRGPQDASRATSIANVSKIACQAPRGVWRRATACGRWGDGTYHGVTHIDLFEGKRKEGLVASVLVL